MLIMPPQGQYLPRYVLLVPEGWDPDVLTIVRPAGLSVLLDDAAVDDAAFYSVGAYEVARVVVADGVHTLQAEQGIAVTVAGYRADDSYGYAGGIGTSVINPDPAG